MAHIFASIKESLTSVLPIALIVLILSVTCVTLKAGVLVLFLFGTIFLILGMSFFTVGSTISMEPLGDGIGKTLTKKKLTIIPILICLALGFLITIQVLGLIERRQHASRVKKFHNEISTIKDDIVFFYKAGATGGTVIKGRLADIEQFAEFVNTEVDEEREILFILAPTKVGRQIMEDVNREPGLTSEANGVIFAIPTEKAFKI